MAAITDLTWQQLQDKLPAGSITVVSGKVVIDVSTVAGVTADALTDTGVVKFLSTLMNAGFQAQTTANVNQTAGEKLAAFNTPTNGTITNGYVPITRALVARSELASATNIIGQNV